MKFFTFFTFFTGVSYNLYGTKLRLLGTRVPNFGTEVLIFFSHRRVLLNLNIPHAGDETFTAGLFSSCTDTGLNLCICIYPKKDVVYGAVRTGCVHSRNIYLTLHELVKGFVPSCSRFVLKSRSSQRRLFSYFYRVVECKQLLSSSFSTNASAALMKYTKISSSASSRVASSR